MIAWLKYWAKELGIFTLKDAAMAVASLGVLIALAMVGYWVIVLITWAWIAHWTLGILLIGIAIILVGRLIEEIS